MSKLYNLYSKGVASAQSAVMARLRQVRASRLFPVSASQSFACLFLVFSSFSPLILPLSSMSQPCRCPSRPFCCLGSHHVLLCKVCIPQMDKPESEEEECASGGDSKGVA